MRLAIRLFLIFVLSVLGNSSIVAQETLPIYSDYLSDNVYLLHPAAAGVGNAGKIRATSLTQWQGIENAPNIQTLSFHNRYGKKAALGFAVFRDENGNRSRQGLQATYAYHLNLSTIRRKFQQLSFGFSISMAQNKIDTSNFGITGDTAVDNLNNSDNYFNGDFGAAFHRGKFFSYLSVRSLFLTTKTQSQFESLNLMKFLLSAGYFFGDEDYLQYEPSILTIYEPYYSRTLVDLNMKFYKNLEMSKIWFAISYRQSFEDSGNGQLNYFSPILGVNYKNLMFSYTYTEQLGDLGILPRGGYHQFTLGIDVFVKRTRLAACPNINSGFY